LPLKKSLFAVFFTIQFWKNGGIPRYVEDCLTNVVQVLGFLQPQYIRFLKCFMVLMLLQIWVSTF